MEMGSGTLFPQADEELLEFFHVEPHHISLSLTQWVLLDARDIDDDEHLESLSDDFAYSDVLGDQNHDDGLEFFDPSHIKSMKDEDEFFGIPEDHYDGIHDVDDGEKEEEDDDDGDGGYGDELDDELVPRGMRGKLVRERMRKLGKRHFSKMRSSKRCPHLYVKPGCVHGKHGLGMKHSI